LYAISVPQKEKELLTILTRRDVAILKKNLSRMAGKKAAGEAEAKAGNGKRGKRRRPKRTGSVQPDDACIETERIVWRLPTQSIHLQIII
jgi:hypothetical protein